MRNLREINLNEGGTFVNRLPPTSEQITFVENLIEAKLPAPYLELLQFSNGGHPELDTFYYKSNDIQQHWNIDKFFHISFDTNDMYDVVWNYNHRWNNANKHIVPIAQNGGGDLFCLDLSENGKGRIIVWIHDDPEISLLEVANSFEALIDELILNPDYI